MKLGLKGLTLGGVLALSSVLGAAQAAPVVLDFEAPAATLNDPVGGVYTGFEFTGDNLVRNDSMFRPRPIPPSLQFLVSDGGFIVDVLDPVGTPFNSLYFDYAGGMFVYIVDTDGNRTTVQIDQSLVPAWFNLSDPVSLSPSPVLLDKSARIDYVEFARNGVAGGLLAIDNLTFDLQPGSSFPPNPPGPNPVPEPAGYALAALALLGAGLATRRRRR